MIGAVTPTAAPTASPTPAPTKTVDIKDVALESDTFGSDWYIKVAKPEGM